MPHKESKTQLIAISLGLILISLAITGYSARSPLTVSRSARFFDWIYGPIREVISSSVGGVTGLFTNYTGLVSIRADYEELQRRTRVLEEERERAAELIQENERLRKLMNATDGTKLKRIAARVNGYRHTGWFHTISINGGSNAGIKPQSAVVTHDGVVGQVISVGEAFSRVLLLTDHTSSIDALVQSSRARGIVEGISDRQLGMRFAMAVESISVGDRVITSGFDGVFPPGLLIGRVSATENDSGALFKAVTLQPAVDVGALEEVVVLVGQNLSAGEDKPNTEGKTADRVVPGGGQR